MPDRRPRHVSSETKMPDHRPIGHQHDCEDRHASLETNMLVENHWRPTCLQSPIVIQTHLFKFTFNKYFLLIILELCKDSIRQVGLWWTYNYAFRSPMCLRLCMYVGLCSGMSVYDQTCQSQMGLRSGYSVSDGSPMKHTQVSDGFRSSLSVSDGPQSSMLVSDGSPIKHVRLR